MYALPVGKHPNFAKDKVIAASVLMEELDEFLNTEQRFRVEILTDNSKME